MNTEVKIKNGSTSIVTVDKDLKHIKLKTAGTYIPNNIDIELTNIDGTATASDIRSGKTGYVNGTQVTGSLSTYSNEYTDQGNLLCFTANTANNTIRIAYSSVVTQSRSFQYRINCNAWTDYTMGSVLNLSNIGDKIYWRGNNQTIGAPWNTSTGEANYCQFVLTGSFSASGHINTLLSYDGSITSLTDREYCFYHLFDGCSTLTTAPQVDFTNTAESCYDEMFNGCTALITAPKLPATVMSKNCYAYMFSGCTTLASVPALPATTLAEQCYYGMFSGCTSLIVSDTSGTGYDNAWTIPSSGTFTNTYFQSNMFYACATGGGRASDSMTGASGNSYTYYTQNEPVS